MTFDEGFEVAESLAKWLLQIRPEGGDRCDQPSRRAWARNVGGKRCGGHGTACEPHRLAGEFRVDAENANEVRGPADAVGELIDRLLQHVPQPIHHGGDVLGGIGKTFGWH